MKVIFFGTSPFGIPALRFLSANFNVISVFTNPPMPAGRGQKLKPSPIEEEAVKLGLKVVHSAKPKLEDVKEDFDIGIVVSYGAIISKNILEKAKYGFLNIHPSDLPKFRGASPIERTLEMGETSTRICIIKMTPRLDDGNILAFSRYEISSEENSLDLHEKFAKIGAEILPNAIKSLVNKEEGEVQEESKTTYASKIKKEELELKEGLKTIDAINKIRAFASFGYPFFFHEGKRVKILKAKKVETPLSALDLKMVDGYLHPILIKPEGKNVMKNQKF